MKTKTHKSSWPQAQSSEVQPVVLRRFGGDWKPLASPTTDVENAKAIAESEFEFGETRCVAAGVMDAEFHISEYRGNGRWLS